MNAITKTEAPRPSLIATMAAKFNMDPVEFEKTVRATVMPANHTNEQFAALMMVAKEYNLNPVVKEIYAFPAKGGGIVPIVSVDGWVNLVNSHPASDGMEFDFDHDDKGTLVSCTCRMYRKDRGRPVTVTEYLLRVHSQHGSVEDEAPDASPQGDDPGRPLCLRLLRHL
jgi:hypothetical protein